MSEGKSRLDEFVEMRAAIVRSVARCWANQGFEREFVADPIVAMKKTFNYEFPFDVDFKAVPSDAAKNPHYFDPEHTGGWVGRNNEIHMVLPPAPPPEQRAEALAAYNASHLLFLTDRKR